MKKLTTLLAVVFTLAAMLCMSIPASAANPGSITRVYGSETRAIDNKSFTEFYEGNYFVWFQMDTDVDAPKDYKAINQQVLGDATIKSAVNTKLKLGGLTVKQINASDGSPYAAMIAHENANGKLRISIWLSWGGSTVQSLFEKEVKSTFTVEILDGFVVPGKTYTIAKPEYVKIKPVKYELSLADLEFGKDPKNAKYTAEKESWSKPLFEKLTAQWKIYGSAAPTTTTSKPKTDSTTTVKPNTSDTTTQASVTDTTGSETIDTTDAETETTTTTTTAASDISSETTKDVDGGEQGKSVVLPIILAIVGVAIIGGGVFLFIKQSKGKVN